MKTVGKCTGCGKELHSDDGTCQILIVSSTYYTDIKKICLECQSKFMPILIKLFPNNAYDRETAGF